MESKPVQTILIHDLRNKLCDLYESDSIFDKFECTMDGTGLYPFNIYIYIYKKKKKKKKKKLIIINKYFIIIIFNKYIKLIIYYTLTQKIIIK